MYWSYSNVLPVVLYIREEYFSKSNVGAPFRQKIMQSIKNASWLAHHTSNNKNKIVAHPTVHGNAHFGQTQQPINNCAALV
jgi:hypothetical protein